MTSKFISYADAVKRFGNSYVLCNNIPSIDPYFFEDCYFDMYDEEENPIDIYQYFISDCSENDVKFLSQWYGLKFSYSSVLDCFVLCVDHFGTMWSGVMIEDKSNNKPTF